MLLTPESLGSFYHPTERGSNAYDRRDGYGVPFVLIGQTNGTSDVQIPNPGFPFRVLFMVARALGTDAGNIFIENDNSFICQVAKGTTDHASVFAQSSAKDGITSYFGIGAAADDITIDASAGEADCAVFCIPLTENATGIRPEQIGAVDFERQRASISTATEGYGVPFLITASLVAGSATAAKTLITPDIRFRILGALTVSRVGSQSGSLTVSNDGTAALVVDTSTTDNAGTLVSTVDDAAHDVLVGSDLTVVSDNADSDADLYIFAVRV